MYYIYPHLLQFFYNLINRETEGHQHKNSPLSLMVKKCRLINSPPCDRNFSTNDSSYKTNNKQKSCTTMFRKKNWL